MITQRLGPAFDRCEQLFTRLCQVLESFLGVFPDEFWVTRFICGRAFDFLSIDLDLELNGWIAKVLFFCLLQCLNLCLCTLLLFVRDRVASIEVLDGPFPA